jgi:hypothetical protein
MSYSAKIFSTETVESNATTATNNSGSAIAKGIPVSVDSNGELQTVDVTNEISVKAFVGVAMQSISNGQSGQIITSGRMQNVTTSFAVGDIIYISKTGGITNITPEAGVNSFVVGDFAVKIGVILKNRQNPLNKDFLVNPVLLGQL